MITILNTCAPNDRAAKYVNQKLLEPKRERDKPISILGDFKGPLLPICKNNCTEIAYRRPQHHPIGSYKMIFFPQHQNKHFNCP